MSEAHPPDERKPNRDFRSQCPHNTELQDTLALNRTAFALAISYVPIAQGLEQLFEYLETAYNAFLRFERLAPIAPLVVRATADLQVALAAAQSGLIQVVSDQMRDVLELELLFHDFSITHDHIAVWLTSDARKRMSLFKPSTLRQRVGRQRPHVERRLKTCYDVHSQLLHVNPLDTSVLWPRGVTPITPSALDMCLAEVLEHYRRLFIATHGLMRALRANDDEHDPRSLGMASQAWAAMQARFGFHLGVEVMKRNPPLPAGPLVNQRHRDAARNLTIAEAIGYWVAAQFIGLVAHSSGQPTSAEIAELRASALDGASKKAASIITCWIQPADI